MESIESALQAALYQCLSAACSAPVYDAVPDDSPYPYITLDSSLSQNISPLSGRTRKQHLCYLSVWSRYHGKAEVKRLISEMEHALDRKTLALSTGRMVSMNVLRTQATRDADLMTYMGNVDLSIITTE